MHADGAQTLTGRSRQLGGALLSLVLALSACSAAAPVVAPPQPERPSTDDLLRDLGVALGRGDVAAATRLATRVEVRSKTPRQRQMLALLTAGMATLAPPPAASPRSSTADAWGASVIRVRRTVPDSQVDAAGYDALPFFDSYREAAACCQYALFDLGELTITPTDTLPEEYLLYREQAQGAEAIELDFGEFLRRAGLDSRRTVYHGDTRVVDDRLLHHYEDATGRVVTGVTELESGAVRTALLRHGE